MMFLWIYLAGYAWFWRYTVGYIINEMSSYRRDGFDYGFGIIMGTFGNIIWPGLVLARGIYVLCKKAYKGGDLLDRMFPGPKEIETRAEKASRLEYEKRVAEDMAHRAINLKERELGLELTEWN